MKRTLLRPLLSVSAAALSIGISAEAQAVQFSYLDPGYTQEIFTGPTLVDNGPVLGVAFGGAGQLIARPDGPGILYEYSLVADTAVNGTSVHSYTTRTVAGLGMGRGMTNGLDGFIYANTEYGVQRVDPVTWTVTNLPGTAPGATGIATLSDGRIAHTDSFNLWIFDPSSGSDTRIYQAGTLIDGIAVSPTDEIFLGAWSDNRVIVINSSGALLNDVAVSHTPDGMAFGAGAAFANNTDGTMTRLTFSGAGYTGAVTETVFASGGAYGDLGAVGPDGAFYVTQAGGWGSGGINWDNGASTDDIVVVRIAALGGGGFDTPGKGAGGSGSGTASPVPEPGTILLLGSGLFGLGYYSRWLKGQA